MVMKKMRNVIHYVFISISLIFYSTVLIAKVQVEADTFLWQIEKKGAPTSYLLGTIHIGKEGAVLSANIKKLLAKVDVLVLESEVNAGGQPFDETMALVRKMYDSAPSLPLLLGPIYTKKLSRCELLRSQEGTLHYLRPWAAAMLCSYVIPKGMDVKSGVDFLLNSEANERQIRVLPLETASEMAGYFAKILPEEKAVTLLKINIDEYAKMQGMVKRLVDEYAQNQFQNVIYELFNERAMLKGLSKEDQVFWKNWLYQELLFNRNQKWLPKLVETLKAKPTLIGVGAGHLPTEKGLINLLRSEGFTVTPVLTYHSDDGIGTGHSLVWSHAVH